MLEIIPIILNLLLNNPMDTKQIIRNTMNHEGSRYVDHPLDKGGPTRYGITLATLQSVNPGATAENIRNLKPTEAINLYEKLYFFKPQVDRLPEAIQDIVFDMNVLHGIKNSTLILQRGINVCGRNNNLSVKEDGLIGSRTIIASHICDPHDLRMAVNNERVKFINNIVKNNPKQRVFQKGWLTRVASFFHSPENIG